MSSNDTEMHGYPKVTQPDVKVPDYEPRMTQLQRELIDQLQQELAMARSNERALLATVAELQDTIRMMCHENARG